MLLKELKEVFVHRLKKRGLEVGMIPGFIRLLANSFLTNPGMNLLQVNKRLNYLGWDDFEIDYHTMQLAISCFESESIKNYEYKPAEWFVSNFSTFTTHSGKGPESAN